MSRKRIRSGRWHAPSLALLLVSAGLLGCGADKAREPANLALPVIDMQTGDQTMLSSLIADERPTLLWFWAPWCEVCRAEAATIRDFAESSEDQLQVVAVGGRDSLEAGERFVAEHDLEDMPLAYDEPSEVWDAFAIGAQPAAVLLDPEAHELRRWQGPFEPAEVLSTLASEASSAPFTATSAR